jgi:hypothetical protein
MRAAYFESALRPRRLARRDRNGYPAIEASRRRRAVKLPPIDVLMAMPREPRTVTAKSGPE